MIETIILIVIIIIAIGYVVQALKRGQESSQTKPNRIATADSAGPTETGRYRVQEIVGNLPKTSSSPPSDTADSEEKSKDLPDPFDD